MRYCCLEIRTSCGSCGQPVPVNGPFREIICQSCFEKVVIPADIHAGFLNDFEEDYDGLEEREGSGGTLMSGSGTYKYGCWRLTPRCPACKEPLSLPDAPGTVKCSCGETYRFYRAPGWLVEEVPSLKWCISGEEPSGETGSEPETSLSGESLKPVVMSCPQCSGALSISTGNERIMTCEYCDSEVYVPDAIWKRLHPVKKVQQWFACFDGKTEKQLLAQRRQRDKQEEEEELKRWKARKLPLKKVRKGRPYIWLGAVFIILFLAATAIVAVNSKGVGFAEALVIVAPYSFALIAVTTTLYIIFSALFYGRSGPGKDCREALAAIAGSRGWTHEGTSNKRQIGYVREKYKGRDIEIDPSDEYAIEIEVDDCPFHLTSDPPGYPPDDMFRFSTGTPLFDDLIPIRYARPDLVRRMEELPDSSEEILKPLTWFFERWGKRIGRIKVDWSSIQVHITPGCYDVMDSGGRYVPAEDLEPLFDDMMILAEALEAVAAGKEPELA